MPNRRTLLVPLTLAVALAAGACNKDKSGNTLSQDTTLSRDLAMANHDSAAQPQLKDVPSSTATPATTPPAAAPAPARSQPERPARRRSTSGARSSSSSSSAAKSAPESTVTPSGNTETRGSAGSERAVATIPAGSVIGLASDERVCTNTNKAGDHFTATVNNAVTTANGTVVPAGAKATIAVTDLKRSGNSTQPIQMTFAVSSLSWDGKTYPVTATIDHVDVDKVRNSSTKSDAAKVAGGAVVGAILGQVIGHNTKSTVIGGAAGAVAGTAVAMGTAGYEGCVPSGGNIQIKLTQPATVQP